MFPLPSPAPVVSPQHEREPILDVLRGFAILGILLVNIQFMRGTEWMVFAGDADALPDAGFTLEASAQFAIGWLASGKFLSSLALLFGAGAAMSTRRTHAAGGSPRAFLLRRYRVLIVFGLAHMILLYPGDILFVYGVAGLLLVASLNLGARAFAVAAPALLGTYTLVMIALVSIHTPPASGQPVAAMRAEMIEPLSALRLEAIAAFTEGAYADVVSVHAFQALTLQEYQLIALPWILALFMIGYAVGRSGILDDFPGRVAMWRRAAWIGIAAGVPANVALGFGGPLGSYAPSVGPGDTALLVAATFAQAIGAPLLAVGYLSALAVYCVRRGAIQPLAAVGRMALTAYLLQSGLALAIIIHFRLYDRLSTVSALLLVAAIWCVLLVACPLWLRRYRFGPAEWLWRSLSYGRLQPMRIPALAMPAPLASQSGTEQT